MDVRTAKRMALHNTPLIASTGGRRRIDPVAEIARLQDECEKLRERLGQAIQKRAIAIAKHQRALLQQGRAEASREHVPDAVSK